MREKQISKAVIKRLPRYRRYLRELQPTRTALPVSSATNGWNFWAIPFSALRLPTSFTGIFPICRKDE